MYETRWYQSTDFKSYTVTPPDTDLQCKRFKFMLQMLLNYKRRKLNPYIWFESNLTCLDTKNVKKTQKNQMCFTLKFDDLS